METKECILSDILSFLRVQYPRLREKEIPLQGDLIRDRIIDSLGILDLIAYIEDKYDIRVSDSAVESRQFLTLANIAEYIDQESVIPAEIFNDHC